MYKDLRHSQQGAVAMITVVFIAILLTIITTSFISITVNEQREATDDDLTTRAFYAAESGVQDAIVAIKNRSATPLANADDCTPEGGVANGELSDSDGLNTSYTCQIIDMNPTDYQARLDPGKPVFFKLDSDGAAVASFKVNWHKYGDESSGNDGTDAVERTVITLPPANDWNQSGDPIPAMIRLQVITIPSTGSFGRSNIGNYVAFLSPGGSTSAATSLSALDPTLTTALSVIGTDCSYVDAANPGTGEYFCNYSVNGLASGLDHYVRIAALYESTNFQLLAYDSANNPVGLEGAQAVIDVTGKASDVYRRVEKRVNLAQDEYWPAYAIESATDICKNFTITDTAEDNPANNPDTTDFSEANTSGSGSCY